MKFGTLHIIKDRTWRIQDERVQAALAQVAEAEARVERARQGMSSLHIAGFMHPPTVSPALPACILDPDPWDERSRQATERVVAAYHRARSDARAPHRSLWNQIEASPAKAPFFEAIVRGDIETVGSWLGRMFQTDLVWGLGYVHEQVPAWIREKRKGDVFFKRLLDMLLSLAEATGAATVLSKQHQGADAWLRQLDFDAEVLLAKTEWETGLDLSFPQVGGAYGARLGGKLVTPDSMHHGYTAWRLGQLAEGAIGSVAEIGGGYGCLAYLCHRAGWRCRVYDLPWVNALQGYFLLMTRAAPDVRLYGEGEGRVEVLPHWCFAELEDRSVDHVVNTNSMPEMAEADCRAYLETIRRVARVGFLSINQESGVRVEDLPPQNVVGPLALAAGLKRISRQRWWMGEGYVEEVFRPA